MCRSYTPWYVHNARIYYMCYYRNVAFKHINNYPLKTEIMDNYERSYAFLNQMERPLVDKDIEIRKLNFLMSLL